MNFRAASVIGSFAIFSSLASSFYSRFISRFFASSLSFMPIILNHSSPVSLIIRSFQAL